MTKTSKIGNLIKLFHKIRQKDIRYSFRIMCYVCWRKFRFVRFPCIINPRFYYYLVKLIFLPNFKKKRILGVWDYKSLPWSVGDPLVFIEKLSILKIKHDAEEIDICVVYDRDKPLGKRTSFLGDPVTSENHQDYSLEYLPLYSTCPYLGSVYQFNSRKEFYHFLKKNYDRYDIFPPLSQHLGETFDYSDGGFSLMNQIREFYQTHGYIPELRIGDMNISWAMWFYKNHLPNGSIPISLSLKQTVHAPERNAEPAVWLSFIDMCKRDFPEAMFVFVGLRGEDIDGMRNRSNVIIAKDFGTSLIEDLALIRASLLYMGTGSGPNIIAMFSDLPYLIFQHPDINIFGIKRKDYYSLFPTDGQKVFSTNIAVTPELLFQEFAKLYLKLDRNRWRNEVLKKARNKCSRVLAIGR